MASRHLTIFQAGLSVGACSYIIVQLKFFVIYISFQIPWT